jgi:hypothetical protein
MYGDERLSHGAGYNMDIVPEFFSRSCAARQQVKGLILSLESLTSFDPFTGDRAHQVTAKRAALSESLH